MNVMPGYPSSRRRFLESMPEEVASSFTELQLEMIEHALEGGKWRDHPVDVRLSIPVLRRRFYFVLLAGPEQRSAERRISERARRPLRSVSDMIVFAVFLLLLVPMAIGSLDLIFMAWNSQ